MQVIVGIVVSGSACLAAAIHPMRAEAGSDIYEACQVEVVLTCSGAADTVCLVAGMDRCDEAHGVALWPMRDNQLRGPERRAVRPSAPAGRMSTRDARR
jgi:hypothetical protein